jgi:hypothetical protein
MRTTCTRLDAIGPKTPRHLPCQAAAVLANVMGSC